VGEQHVRDLPQRPSDPAGPVTGEPGHRDGRPEPTGDAAVDAALADLQAIDPQLASARQLPALVAVHEALQQRLSSTEG